MQDGTGERLALKRAAEAGYLRDIGANRRMGLVLHGCRMGCPLALSMNDPLEIAKTALQRILEVEKSASSGWNAVMNMASIARRALEQMEKNPFKENK